MDCTNKKYSWPSTVYVTNYVTVRPDLRKGEERSIIFNIWKEQMLCLVESQNVAGFINGEIVEPESDEHKLWRRSDRLVKGWILGSIGTDLLQKVYNLQTAREVWLELERIFNEAEIQPLSHANSMTGQDDGMLNDDEAATSEIQVQGYANRTTFSSNSKIQHPIATNRQSMGCTNEEYLCLSSVNVANFVTVRPELRDENRSGSFKIWKEQMMCLLESQDMVDYINGNIYFLTNRMSRSGWLVKGWILGSIGTDVLDKVSKLKTARDVWLGLKAIFDYEVTDSDSGETGPLESKDYSNYEPLFNAALRGDWKTANESFFKKNIEETEAIINKHGEIALHVAVRSRRATVFVMKLVDMMRSKALEIKNKDGHTALHEAVIVGNTNAAKAMVEKNQDLLKMMFGDDEESFIFNFKSCSQPKNNIT